jgi:hypothetical protein
VVLLPSSPGMVFIPCIANCNDYLRSRLWLMLTG